jgi:hypothetical protein
MEVEQSAPRVSRVAASFSSSLCSPSEQLNDPSDNRIAAAALRSKMARIDKVNW